MADPGGASRRLFAVLAIAVADAAMALPLAVRVYPLSGDESQATAIADAQALLESAVPSAARRSEQLVAAKPLVLPPTCGRVARPDCLARLAQGGIVVSGTVRLSGGVIIIALQAVDSAARVQGPVNVGIDSFVQSAEPLARALLSIESRLPVASSPGAPTDRAPGHGAPSRPSGTLEAAQPPPGATGSSPTLRFKDPEPVRGMWRRTAGYWATSAGVALLAGGATVAQFWAGR